MPSLTEFTTAASCLPEFHSILIYHLHDFRNDFLNINLNTILLSEIPFMAAWGFPVRDKAPCFRDDHHVWSPHLLFPGDQLSGLPRSVLVFVLHSIKPPSPWQAKTTVLPGPFLQLYRLFIIPKRFPCWAFTLGIP